MKLNGQLTLPAFDRLKVMIMMISLQNISIFGAQDFQMLMEAKNKYLDTPLGCFGLH